MTQVILYKTPEGQAAIVAPILESGLTIEQIAQKDVPAGLPYKIVDASALPAEPQEWWAVDEAALDDGVGADWGAGGTPVVGWNYDGTPMLEGQEPKVPPAPEPELPEDEEDTP